MSLMSVAFFLVLSVICFLQASAASCTASCIAYCEYGAVTDYPSACSSNSSYVCQGGVAQPSTTLNGARPECTATCVSGTTVCTQVIAANGCPQYYYGSKTYTLDTKCDPTSTPAACIFPATTVGVTVVAALSC